MTRYNAWCSIPTCYSSARKNPGISFHSIPKLGKQFILYENETGLKEFLDIRNVWALKLKFERPLTDFMNICSLHFQDNDFFPRGM